MNGILRFLRREERGSAAVIIAVSLSLLFSFTALAVDFGATYVTNANAQNAADSAALAAAHYLPVSSGDASGMAQVKDVAVSYVEKNGFTIAADGVELGDMVGGRYTSVSVTVSGEVGMTFARVIGIDTVPFKKDAKAKIIPCTSATGVAPLGVEQSVMDAAIASGNTQHIYLKYGGGDGDTGSYGAIDLDGVKGGGANDFESWLLNGYSGTITVGEGLLPVEPGNMAAPTETAISARYYQCTHYPDQGGCSIDHYDSNCPRLLKTLVIETVGTQYVKVKGFAVFIIEGVYGDEVLGSYVKMLEPDLAGGDADWSAEYGLYSVRLVE